MANSKEIKQRIQSVRNTQQITKAMKMVSAAKLHKTQRSALASRPYSKQFSELIGRLASKSDQADVPLLISHPLKRLAIVLVTGNRGLAGGFHMGLIKRALEVRNAHPDCEVQFIVVGRKGEEFLKMQSIPILAGFHGISDIPSYEESRPIANFVADAFVRGQLDKIVMVYQAFLSPGRQETAVKTLLPVLLPLASENSGTEYLCEEGLDKLLANLLPLYLHNEIYHGILESKTSEHVARMIAMSSASDNADDMIGKLTLSYNRSRQTAITQEIAEIVGGTEALS